MSKLKAIFKKLKFKQVALGVTFLALVNLAVATPFIRNLIIKLDIKWSLYLLGGLLVLAGLNWVIQKIRTRKKSAIDRNGVYHLLLEMNQNVLNYYIELANFSYEVFSREKFLEGNFASSRHPVFHASTILGLLDQCRQEDLSDSGLKSAIDDILIKAETLSKTSALSVEAFTKLTNLHRSPFTKIIFQSIQANPYKAGLIVLPELESANDLHLKLCEFRFACYELLNRIHRATDACLNRGVVKDDDLAMERIERFSELTAHADAESPIKFAYSNLLTEIGEECDHMRLHVLQTFIAETQYQKIDKKAA